jgi:hypothetical protein
MIPSPMPIPKPAKKDFMRHSWEHFLHKIFIDHQ